MNLPGHQTTLLCLSVDDTLSSPFARLPVNAKAGTIADNLPYTCTFVLSGETRGRRLDVYVSNLEVVVVMELARRLMHSQSPPLSAAIIT